MISPQASRSNFYTPEWLRTKHCSFEVTKLFSAENGNSRFSGFRSRTIRPAKACASELRLDRSLGCISLSRSGAQFSLQRQVGKDQNSAKEDEPSGLGVDWQG